MSAERCQHRDFDEVNGGYWWCTLTAGHGPLVNGARHWYGAPSKAPAEVPTPGFVPVDGRAPFPLPAADIECWDCRRDRDVSTPATEWISTTGERWFPICKAHLIAFAL